MDPRRDQQRQLVVLAVTVIGLSRLLDGPLVWLVAALLLAAMLIGSLQVMGEGEPAGVPVEALVTPSIAAVGALGAIRIVPLGIGLAPALLLAGLLIDRALTTELTVLARPTGPTSRDRALLLSLALLIAFVAFTGVAAIIPGGLVEPTRGGAGAGGGNGQPLSESGVALLALADAVVAGLLGYRFAGLRVATVRDALWSAVTYAAIIAIAAGLLRAVSLQRLLGPAILTLVLYLWDQFQGAAPSLRRDPRWVGQALILVVLAFAVVLWNVQLRS
jgi:hypothetical protein